MTIVASAKLRYLKNPIYILAIIASCFLILEWNALSKAPEAAGIDFSIYYKAAKSFQLNSETLYELNNPSWDQFLYPPPSIAIFLLFSFFPINISYILFVGFMILCLMWCLHLWGKANNHAGFNLPKTENWAFIIFTIASAPAYHNVSLGQVNCLVLVLSVLFLYLLNDRPILAGIALAVAIWIKIYPVFLLLLALFSKEGKKSVISCGITGIAIPIILLPLVPFQLYTDYLLKLPEVFEYTSAHIINQSITAFELRFILPFEDSYSFPNIHRTPNWLRYLNYFILIFTLAVAIKQTIKHKSNIKRNQLTLGAILLSFSAIFSPLGWGHAFILSAPLMLTTYKSWQGKFNNTGLLIITLLIGIIYLIPVYNRMGFIDTMPVIIKNIYYSRILFITTLLITAALLGMGNKSPKDSKQ